MSLVVHPVDGLWWAQHVRQPQIIIFDICRGWRVLNISKASWYIPAATRSSTMSSAAAVHNARFMNPSFETRPRTFMSGQHLVATAESASFANKGTDSDLVGRAFGPEPNIDFRNHLPKQRNVDSIACQKLRIPRMWSYHRPWGNNPQPSWTLSTVHWATKIYLRVYEILEILIRPLSTTVWHVS